MFAIISRRKILVLMLSMILSALIICKFYFVQAKVDGLRGATNTQRLDFIYSLGIEVEETPTTESIIIPTVFSDVYTEYNKLQQEAGFDIQLYRGNEVIKYTYNLKDDDFIVVNLLVYNDIIIGGDICNIKLNGFIKPLIKMDNE